MVRHYGEPFADSSAIPSFYLAELTRRHVTVALNGDGGDETFAGYTRYVANSVAGQLDAIPGPLRRSLAAVAARMPEGGSCRAPPNEFRRLAGTLALDAPARYARYVSWFDAERRARALQRRSSPRRSAPPAGTTRSPRRWPPRPARAVLDRILEVDVSTYLVDDLLAKIDIATMANALEARSPFLDHELMEFAASIPPQYKLRGREKKWILREAHARVAARRDPRPPQAGLHRAAGELAPRRAARVVARRPARPRRRSTAATSSPPPCGACSTATTRARTGTTSASGRC